MVLREVPDGGFVSPDHFSAIDEGTIVAARFSHLRFGYRGRIRQQSIQQRRLAGTVAPHKYDLFATDHTGSEAADDFGLAVRLCHTLELKNVLAGRALHLKL